MRFVLLALALALAAPARADDKQPARVSHEDMLLVTNAQLRVQLANRDIVDVLRRYGIDAADYFNGRAGWREDGTIVRAPAPTPAPAPTKKK